MLRYPVFLLLLIVGLLRAHAPGAALAGADRWTREFRLDACAWSDTGGNDYFPLRPGYRLELEGNTDAGEERLVVTVLRKRVRIGKVLTRVVREEHRENGRLVELSENFFAVCRETNSVFYFGEDVEIYEPDGSIRHDGAWRAFEEGNSPGLIMPGLPLVGARYYQELAPGVALDRAEIVSVDGVARVPAGRFQDVLVTRESTPLEPGAVDTKRYAPGVGLIQDADLRLVAFGFGEAVSTGSRGRAGLSSVGWR